MGVLKGKNPAIGETKGNLMHLLWQARAETTQHVVDSPAGGSILSKNFLRSSTLSTSTWVFARSHKWSSLATGVVGSSDHGLEVGV